MKYFTSLVVLYLAFHVYAFSQTVKVVDFESGEPLEMVLIYSDDAGISTKNRQVYTDKKGEANLSNLKGAKSITVRYLGYQSLYTSYAELKSLGFKLKLKQSSLELNEVVVSASRWKQNKAEVPVKISSIKAEEVEFQNPQTAADLLGISSQVFIQKSQQGGGSPMIRGFATNRLIYSVDGVRMNTAIFRGGNIQNVINLDPFAVEGTEVMFGPSSVLYGSDAIGGVMSFRTLEPKLSSSDKTEVSANFNSRYSTANQEKTAHLDFNIKKKKLSFLSSFTHWDYDDLMQGSHGPKDFLKPFYVKRVDGKDVVVEQEDKRLQIPSAYSQFNTMQKLLFAPNEKWQLSYAFHHSETSSYGRYDRHNRLRNGQPRYAEWGYGPQLWQMHQFSLNHQDTLAIYDEFSLKLAQQTFKESRIDRDFNDPLRRTREEEVKAYSVNLDFLKSLNSKTKVFYGAEYVLDVVESSARLEDIEKQSVVETASRYPQADWQSLGAYFNYDYSASERINLLAGARFNYFGLEADFSQNQPFYSLPFDKAEINNSNLSGSIGAVYKGNRKMIFRTNLSTAFRAPNVDDIGKVFDSEPGAVVVPNPSLKEEYAYNIDFGFAKVFNQFLKLDVSFFYTYLEDALVRRDFQLNGQDSILYDGELSKVQAVQNAAKAEVYGVQAGLEVKFGRFLTGELNLNFQRGEEELDNGETSPSRHAAPAFGSVRFTYQRKKLKAQVYANYQDEVSHSQLSISEQSKREIYVLNQQGNTYAPSWCTLNFKAAYQLHPQLGVNVGVENITDQRYRPYSSGISGAGRNYIFSLKANF